ncbi:histidine phosphatase family protein [Aerococcus agrisoli]|uniref:Histidine phosphatase family protein n=1 Tax=Aerococcus agrisoli TaxID=2487350 RepID=A0A3N4GGJ7_9LACT|nr:histidine phosphatase family protein [Aerococcus agrisoli]RPA58211.1 histidine phosphatase family protein [Aerococcus agrisoli]
MTKIYLTRHGQTLFNVRKKIQGASDSPLTALGIYQAQVAHDYFKNAGITFDAAYSSTSERASDTLEIMAGPDMPYTRLKSLKEWNFGVFESESENLNPPLPYGDFFVQFGGEGQEEFKERAVKALQDLVANDHSNHILVVSHGAFCANALRGLTGYKGYASADLGFTNCSTMVFNVEDGVFTLDEVINHDFSGFEG